MGRGKAAGDDQEREMSIWLAPEKIVELTDRKR
jgi:hypothetical protein